MDVTAEEAFAEACRALGESVVRERILTQRLIDMEKQNAALVQQLLHPDAEPEAS